MWCVHPALFTGKFVNFPDQREWFSRRFGLKTGIEILTIVVLNRVWFSREPRERINVFVFSTLNEQ